MMTKVSSVTSLASLPEKTSAQVRRSRAPVTLLLLHLISTGTLLCHRSACFKRLFVNETSQIHPVLQKEKPSRQWGLRSSPVSESISKREKQDTLDSPVLRGPTTSSCRQPALLQHRGGFCISQSLVCHQLCLLAARGEGVKQCFYQVRPFVRAAAHHPVILTLSYPKPHKLLLQQFPAQWTPVGSLSSTDFYNACRTSSTPGTSTPLSKEAEIEQ